VVHGYYSGVLLCEVDVDYIITNCHELQPPLLMKATVHTCRCKHMPTYVLAQGELKRIILDGYLIKLIIFCRAI
jgi:hypothetical protein